MSDYLNMTLKELQQEHAELLLFNEELDRRCKHYIAQTERYQHKCWSISSLFIVPKDDHEMTIKAIKTILERVGE